MQKSSIIRTVIEILVFLVLISVIIMFSAALAGVPVETVPSSAYSVGTLNENGKAEESETSIYTPEMYAVKGLDIEVKEKAEITYSIWFYDEDKTFLASTEERETDYNIKADGSPEWSAYFRIRITPKNDRDGKISKSEKTKYANKLTVIIKK